MTFQIRQAEPADLPAAAKLAALMVRLHHDMDPLRFSMLSDDIEAGYEQWLRHESVNRKALVMVAVTPRSKDVLGYAYARLEPRDWNRLLDACGVLHDLVVAEKARKQGVAGALVEAVAAWMKERAARLLVETAYVNDTARAFFAKRGFRPTMVEMTRELGEEDPLSRKR